MPWRALSLLAGGWVAGAALAAAATPPRAGAAAGGPARGIIVETANQRSMGLARQAGFTLAKMILGWASLEPAPGSYQWEHTDQNDFDNVLRAARAGGLRLVIRVDGVPSWAGGSPATADLAAVERFYAALARHGAGTVAAYEILNEPNLPQEWGGPPSPAGYTAFLAAAHRGIKAGDPAALVLGGGPAPSTGGLGGTIEDTDFLDGMYDAGARDAMDALAIHNYGGN